MRAGTYMFLHGGMLHIFFNLMALASLGSFTLANFGLRRFWLITLTTGIGGGLLSTCAVLFSPGALSTGFSGALFGYLAVNYVHCRYHGPPQLEQTFKNYLIWGHIIFIFLTMIGALNIDNLAHMGGMLVGFGVAFSFRKGTFSKLGPKFEYLLITVCTLFLVYGLVRSFFYLDSYFIKGQGL